MAELLPSWQSGDLESLRPFADIRLIAFDVDGTLVHTGRGKLNTAKRLKRALAHPKRQVQITIATGRAFTGVRSLLSGLDLDERTPMILYNGSVVLLPGTNGLLERKTIEEEALARVVQSCEPLGATILAYFFPDSLDWDNPRRDLHENVRGWSQVSHSYEEYNGLPIQWQKGLSELHGNAPVSVLVDTRNNPSAKEKVQANLSQIPSLSCTSSGYPYIEVRPAGSNKGAGLALVAHYMGLSPCQVIAVGDNDNDCEMLRWAGVGISVSSASLGAIESGKYLCRHGVESGVLEVMRLVRQAKRYHGMTASAER